MENDGRISREDLDAALEQKLGSALDAALAKHFKKDQADDNQAKEAPSVGHLIRERKFTLKDEQKGIAAARFVRAMAASRGDVERAKAFVGKVYNDDLGDEIKKAFISSELTSGGALVPPEYAAEIIELLRSKTIVRAAGARTLPMNNGSLTLRKQTAGSSASYVGESQNIGVTQPEVGLITMTSKKLAAIVPISNDLLKFSSSPGADEFVRDDLVMEIALREDRAFLRDDGTEHTPKGLRYWAASVTASAGTSATNIEEDFKDLLNALEDEDVKLMKPVWLMHPSRKNHLRNLRDANGNLIYPETRGPNPTIYGYPIFTSTAIPKNLGGGSNETEIYFVDMVEAIIAEVAGLEIVADAGAAYVEDGNVKSAFSRDETLIRAITRHDFAVRHREAVAVKNAVTWGA